MYDVARSLGCAEIGSLKKTRGFDTAGCTQCGKYACKPAPMFLRYWTLWRLKIPSIVPGSDLKQVHMLSKLVNNKVGKGEPWKILWVPETKRLCRGR